MSTSYGKAMQVLLRSRPGTRIPFPILTGESPRGLDTELYGETNEKDSWGPRSLWPTRRFRVNSREVRLPEKFLLVPLGGLNRALRTTLTYSVRLSDATFESHDMCCSEMGW